MAAFSMPGALIATPITPEMKSDALRTIKNCYANYQIVKTSGIQLTKIKKPPNNASALDNFFYKNRKISKKAFEINFDEFKIFYKNEAKKINQAATAEALRGLMLEYSSNCLRFSQGLLNFVRWSTTGAGEKLYGRIFNEWLLEAHRQKT